MRWRVVKTIITRGKIKTSKRQRFIAILVLFHWNDQQINKMANFRYYFYHSNIVYASVYFMQQMTVQHWYVHKITNKSFATTTSWQWRLKHIFTPIDYGFSFFLSSNFCVFFEFVHGLTGKYSFLLPWVFFFCFL